MYASDSDSEVGVIVPYHQPPVVLYSLPPPPAPVRAPPIIHVHHYGPAPYGPTYNSYYPSSGNKSGGGGGGGAGTALGVAVAGGVAGGVAQAAAGCCCVIL